MESNDWANALKVSDSVFIQEISYRGSMLYPTRVKSISGNYINVFPVAHEPERYNRKNLEETGRKHGRMYMGDPHHRLVEYSPDNVAEFEHQRKVGKCNRIVAWLYAIKFKEVKPELLDEYYNILVQFEKKGDASE